MLATMERLKTTQIEAFEAATALPKPDASTKDDQMSGNASEKFKKSQVLHVKLDPEDFDLKEIVLLNDVQKVCDALNLDKYVVWKNS